jgi:hypothetical protein
MRKSNEIALFDLSINFYKKVYKWIDQSISIIGTSLHL